MTCNDIQHGAGRLSSVGKMCYPHATKQITQSDLLKNIMPSLSIYRANVHLMFSLVFTAQSPRNTGYFQVGVSKPSTVIRGHTLWQKKVESMKRIHAHAVALEGTC